MSYTEQQIKDFAQAAISGTTNRVTVTSGVVDIAATYAGQSSINTVGTISTGTWQATPIATGYGGAPDGGSTGQVLTKNSAADYDYDWADAAGGGGGWGLTGNAGTTEGTNFIGTTDDVNFTIRRNNSVIAVFLRSSTKIGLFAGSGASEGNTNYFGNYAGSTATNAYDTNSFGYYAGYSATNAYRSNFFGSQSGRAATNATYANMFGYRAGYTASAASYCNLFGYRAGESFTGNNIGSNNIIIGTGISLPDGRSSSINIGGIIFGVGCIFNYSTDPIITPSSSGRIGIGIVTPDTSAILDLTSTTKGLLPPRMSSSDWSSISSKAEGLHGWSTADHAPFWYDGTSTIGFRYNHSTSKFQGTADGGSTWVDLN